MSEDIKNIEFVFPRNGSLEDFRKLDPQEPFSELVISFLDALSRRLMQDPRSNDFPEMLTFAFFCRKANIMQLKGRYYPIGSTRKGRGIVFHISPSNTSLNFAYSLVAGILSGNVNIVRLPSQKFKQVDLFVETIEHITKETEFESFSRRLFLVRYGRSDLSTGYFSSICNARIIWGGDHTIYKIRKNNSLNGTAVDIAFGDKYSICIINADSYVAEEDPVSLARAFYNDTFFFDQRACTSPHLVVWLGSKGNIRNSKTIFWENLYKLARKVYELQDHAAINKLITFCDQAINIVQIEKTVTSDNLIWRVELKELTEDINKYRGHSGYFIEYNANSLDELSGLISKRHQTIAHYGVSHEDWGRFDRFNIGERLKAIGKTSEFSLTWDGYNLIDSLSIECNKQYN